jgi:hypothetical protein
MVFQTHASLLIFERKGYLTNGQDSTTHSWIHLLGRGAFVNMGMNLELFKPWELLDHQVIVKLTFL